VLWRILGPRSWGTEPVVILCWCAGIADYLFYKISAMAECMISGLSAYKMLWPYVALMAIPVLPPLSVGADRQCYQTTKILLYLVTMHSETQMSEG
jgi:hypothetical protein